MRRNFDPEWYVPGAMLYTIQRANISGAANFSTAATGSWVNITANAKTLQVVYTPAADCQIEIVLCANALHSVASAVFYIGIDIGGTIYRQVPFGAPAANTSNGRTCVYSFSASGSTAYTITGKAYNGTAGTLTVSNALVETELTVKAWRNP